jgi:hypothetical protein
MVSISVYSVCSVVENVFHFTFYLLVSHGPVKALTVISGIFVDIII